MAEPLSRLVERCLHFTKSREFAMYQEAVMVPMGDWKHSRLRNLSETDRRRDESKVNSGFGKKIDNWIGREKAYPTNVLHLATECGNKSHSAAFPPSLPAWFIKLFTKPDDLVLDPFLDQVQRSSRRQASCESSSESTSAPNSAKSPAAIWPLLERFNPNYHWHAMDTIELEALVGQSLADFYGRRMNKLSGLKLRDTLKKKNPYLFRGCRNSKGIRDSRTSSARLHVVI